MYGFNKGLLKQKKRAFTIMEVLLVLFLMGVVAGLFAVNFDALIRVFGRKRPEKVLYNAICEARYQTIQEHAPVYLSFDEKKHAFLIYKDKPDQTLAQFAVEEGIKAVFDLIPPNSYHGGRFQPPGRKEQEVIDEIAFHPDGSSTPAIITLSQDKFELKFKPDVISCGIIPV